VVDDDAILAAMRLIWERMKIVVEPSAAVVLAGALSDSFLEKKKIGATALVLSGGNVDLNRFVWR
jgi:threonine dehydratase